MKSKYLDRRLAKERVQDSFIMPDVYAKYRKMVDDSFPNLSEEQRDAEARIICHTHPDSPHVQKPAPDPKAQPSKSSSDERLKAAMLGGLLILGQIVVVLLCVLIYLVLFSDKAHAAGGTSQIDVITISDGATNFVAAAPFHMNFSGCSVAKAGSTATITCAGTGGGSGTVTSVGDLSPLFTTATRTTTPAFSLTAAAAHAILGNNTAGSAAPTYFVPACASLSDAGVFCNGTSYANLTSVPSTFAPTAHNLLSASHGDTTASAAVRGGGVFALGASPTWTQVAHSAATGGYFKWNGTDQVASTGAAAGTGLCTNQFVSAENADAAPTCTTPTLSSAQFANQGTVNTILHGNAAGNPAFSAVDVSSADISGVLKATAFPALTGDVITSAGALATTLAATISGTHTFTGLFACKNFGGVRCVDVNNSAGWTGSEPGAWLNAAITDMAGVWGGGIVVVGPGNYSATTTVTIPTRITVLLQGAFWNSTGAPNFINNATFSGLMGSGRGTAIVSNNGTGSAVTVTSGANYTSIRDLQIQGSGSNADEIVLNDNLRQTLLENLNIQPPVAGGRCVTETVATQGTEFTKLKNIHCEAPAVSPAFQFDCSAAACSNTEFDQVYAVTVGGAGVGFNAVNGQFSFNSTSTDSSATGYVLGVAAGNPTFVDMLNADAEGDSTVGISILGPGSYQINNQKCSTDAACIAVNSASANTVIIEPSSVGTTGANDITYSTTSTGTHVLIDGGKLSKLVTPTAPAVVTTIANIGTFPGGVKTGTTPPACTAGTAGFMCNGEGTAPTNVASTATIYPSSTTHEYMGVTNGASTATPGMMVRVQPSPVNLTAQTALKTTTTLCASSAGACNTAGQYRISYNFWGSGTACATVTAGSVGLNITWTDENAVAHTTISMPMWDQKSAANGILFNFNTALGTEGASGSYVISTNGSVIQYATTYTACTSGTGTYNLRIAAERLQ